METERPGQIVPSAKARLANPAGMLVLIIILAVVATVMAASSLCE